MTLKEELLSISSYEEYMTKREKFRDLPMDEEIMNHLDRNIFTAITASYDDSICWDAMRTVNTLTRDGKRGRVKR